MPWPRHGRAAPRRGRSLHPLCRLRQVLCLPGDCAADPDRATAWDVAPVRAVAAGRNVRRRGRQLDLQLEPDRLAAVAGFDPPAHRGLRHDQQPAAAFGVEVGAVADRRQLRVVVANGHSQRVRRAVHLDRSGGLAVDDGVGDELADQQSRVLTDLPRQLGGRAEVADELAGLARGLRARGQAEFGVDVEFRALGHGPAPLGQFVLYPRGYPALTLRNWSLRRVYFGAWLPAWLMA